MIALTVRAETRRASSTRDTMPERRPSYPFMLTGLSLFLLIGFAVIDIIQSIRG
jgi:hypothetical protein